MPKITYNNNTKKAKVKAADFKIFSEYPEGWKMEEVLKLRSRGETLLSIGAKFRVTRERIRQIEERALSIIAKSKTNI